METITITIKYTTSVFVQAGWRSIDITAMAEMISAKRCKVVKVLDVDGYDPDAKSGSRTGANRQKFRPASIAMREIDTIKIISKLIVIEET